MSGSLAQDGQSPGGERVKHMGSIKLIYKGAQKAISTVPSIAYRLLTQLAGLSGLDR